MSLFFQKSGILTTVQDLGRHGFRRFGINRNGVMDEAAARIINILLGNPETEALLEMHFPGPEITFRSDTVAAIGGAELTPTLDDVPLENWVSFVAKKNSVLKFKHRISGNRAYLAIKGGIETNAWLGSSSTNVTAEFGGFNGRGLKAGDEIETKEPFVNPNGFRTQRIAPSLIPVYRPSPTVRIIRGAEFELLNIDSRDFIEKQTFTISNSSNRMGFRLEAKAMELSSPCELLSSAVAFGTVQLLPNGQLIVLMADHQTSGGYPRIAHVIGRDLPIIAQLGANDKVSFKLIENEQAENLALAFENELNLLRVGVKLKGEI